MGMPSGKTEKTSKWDNESHAALCVALADALAAARSSPAQQSDVIMKSLQGRDMDFTWQAVRQHLQKLRRGATDANGGSKTPRTPKTKNKEATPKSTPGKRKNSNADSSDDLEDTPSKKTKIKMEIIEGAQEMNGLE